MTTKIYSLDLRIRAVGAISGDTSCWAAARHFGISPSTAIRHQQRTKQTSYIEHSKQGRPFGCDKFAPRRSMFIAKIEE